MYHNLDKKLKNNFSKISQFLIDYANNPQWGAESSEEKSSQQVAAQKSKYEDDLHAHNQDEFEALQNRVAGEFPHAMQDSELQQIQPIHGHPNRFTNESENRKFNYFEMQNQNLSEDTLMNADNFEDQENTNGKYDVQHQQMYLLQQNQEYQRNYIERGLSESLLASQNEDVIHPRRLQALGGSHFLGQGQGPMAATQQELLNKYNFSIESISKQAVQEQLKKAEKVEATMKLSSDKVKQLRILLNGKNPQPSRIRREEENPVANMFSLKQKIEMHPQILRNLQKAIEGYEIYCEDFKSDKIACEQDLARIN